MSLNNMNNRNNEFAEDYGFKLRGDSPVIISLVKPNSLADVSYFQMRKLFLFLIARNFTSSSCHHLIQLGGLKEGDFIVEMCGIDVKWFTQQQLVKLIQGAKSSLELKVITPIDRNYLKVSCSNAASGGLFYLI